MSDRLREAAQLVLDCMLHDGVPMDPEHPRRFAVDAMEAALAEPEPEPVAWMYEARHIDSAWVTAVSLKHPGPEDRYVRGVTPLYTSPPTRRPLTDEEIDALRTALQLIAGTDPSDASLDPAWAVRVARMALGQSNG